MPLRFFNLGGEIDRTAPPGEQFFSSERRVLLALAIGCFILYILYNGERDLWAPDEPRFGQIAKEMLQDGDVFVLRLNGQPYPDKPPLYFYLVCLLTLAVGWLKGAAVLAPSEWMARAPSAAAATAGVFLAYWLGKRLLNRRAAFFGAAATGLSWVYVWQGRSAQLDMPMSAFAIAAIACWVRARFGKGEKAPWTHLFYVFAALATLSKGPPGFIVPFGTVVVFLCWQANPRRTLWSAAAWCAAVLILVFLAGSHESGREALVSPTLLFSLTAVFVLALIVGCAVAWRDLVRQFDLARHALGFALFLTIIGVWLIPMKLSSSKEFAEQVLLTQTLARYFNPEHHYGSMVWYYPPRLLLDWLPWTLLLPAALWTAFRGETPMAAQPRRLLSSWFLFTFVFFSLSPGKRDQYLLPCWPAIGLLFGHLFDRAMAGQRIPPKLLWIPNAALGAGFLLGAVAAIWLHLALVARAIPIARLDSIIYESLGPDGTLAFAGIPIGLLAVPLAVGGAGLIMAAARRNTMAGFWNAGFATVLAWALLALFILPGANAIKSGRRFCDEIDALCRPGQKVASYKMGHETYVFHGDFRLEEVEGQVRLERMLRQPGRQLALMRKTDYDHTFKGQLGDMPLSIVAETYAGGRHVVCVSNKPLGGPTPASVGSFIAAPKPGGTGQSGSGSRPASVSDSAPEIGE